MMIPPGKRLVVYTFAAFLLLCTAPPPAQPQVPNPPAAPVRPAALKDVPIPTPSNLYDYVADKNAAIVLGKALFWDQQVGSDGMACASCHFQAGADNRYCRKKNSLDPGLRNQLPVCGAGMTPPACGPVSQTFNPTATGGGGPNYTLKRRTTHFINS